MSNQASELYGLCREVYELTEWADGDSSLQWWLKYFYAEGKHDLKLVRVEDEKEIGKYDVPLYTSDYLLERLPEWIGKYGDMQMSMGYMKGGTGAFRFFYGRDGQEASIEGTGTTAVSALLKLTIALSEAGELK